MIFRFAMAHIEHVDPAREPRRPGRYMPPCEQSTFVVEVDRARRTQGGRCDRDDPRTSEMRSCRPVAGAYCPSMHLDIRIRSQSENESTLVAAVTRAAFGDDSVVAELPSALSDHPLGGQGFSLVGVTAAGEMVGHVQLSRCWIDDERHLVAGLTLSPLSVLPTYQRRGVGGALVAAALHAADRAGEPFVMLEGDPELYARWGFEPAATHGLTPPSSRIPPAACQISTLTSWDSTTKGALVYNDVFWAHDAVGLRGDSLSRSRRGDITANVTTTKARATCT